MIKLQPYSDFESCSRAVLSYLQNRLDFGLWMVTRVVGEDWVALQVQDKFYDIEDGAVFQWADSFCNHMVQGHGPKVAARVSDVPVYLNAPIGKQVPINAYMGVPVVRSDGSVFGTLCAIDPSSKEESIKDELPTVELLATLLSTVLELELAAQDRQQKLEESKKLAYTDSLTGLLNRSGWEHFTEVEQSRIKRYGESVGVIYLDLDELKLINDSEGHSSGDQLLLKTAECLKVACRSTDVVGRVGGDEFAIMAIDCDQAGLIELKNKVSKNLLEQGIAASIGSQIHCRSRDLSATVDMADRAMYAEKRENRQYAAQV
ncbi:MAG: sensor domain-containing diguanylate cyclase [Gammaproteobacteria bacterium]|nr:sensor domain-containing diguanylate cyclase [Gammaproteobacteria bacterium]